MRILFIVIVSITCTFVPHSLGLNFPEPQPNTSQNRTDVIKINPKTVKLSLNNNRSSDGNANTIKGKSEETPKVNEPENPIQSHEPNKVDSPAVPESKTDEKNHDVSGKTDKSQTEIIKNGIPTDNSQEESGFLTKIMMVSLTISSLFIMFVAYKTYRRSSRSARMRKYGVRLTRGNIEMTPLPLDNDDEDETVFDLKNVPI